MCSLTGACFVEVFDTSVVADSATAGAEASLERPKPRGGRRAAPAVEAPAASAEAVTKPSWLTKEKREEETLAAAKPSWLFCES